jgi:hypothetical protein
MCPGSIPLRREHPSCGETDIAVAPAAFIETADADWSAAGKQCLTSQHAWA